MLFIVCLKSIDGAIGANIYQQNRVNVWTSNVVEQCLSQLSKLGKPFKYIGKILLLLLVKLSYGRSF